jgi:DNA-binding LacI/PurR family transcriptional regulator
MTEGFPILTESWFTQNGSTDPARAAEAWFAWDRPERSLGARYRKALELASGLTAGAVRHYLNGRSYKLSEKTLAKLDAISLTLGVPPAKRKERQAELIRSSLVDRHLALLTEIEGIPSPTYHLGVIRSITHAATERNFSLVLHEVSQSELAADVQRIVRHYRPSAMIMVRLTPDAIVTRTLDRWSIPVVLVHADRLQYPCPPVLANLVPAQDPMAEWLRGWALQTLDALRPGEQAGLTCRTNIVIVAMRDDLLVHDFDSVTGIRSSIRMERKDIILHALQEFNPVLEEVDDYSFRHALRVLQKHPDGCIYVCLSDEIAVGIKHLLEISGKSRQHRIIGFDDSPLAKAEQITSFGHELSETGQLAIGPMTEWFRNMSEGEARWPVFKEVPVEVQLVLRD